MQNCKGEYKMKNKLKLLLKWAFVFLVCFIIIYLIVLFGGWKLFESGDIIFIEIGVALVLSVFVFAFLETVSLQEKKIKNLEKRIEELENKQ